MTGTDTRQDIINDYLAFKPWWYMSEKYDPINYDHLHEWMARDGYDRQRAQGLIDQLPIITEDLPDIIKDSIWKLQIISVLAQLYAKPTIDDSLLNEKISTYAIKAKLADYSLWKAEEIEVLEDKLSVDWVVMMANNYDLKKFEAYAKTLRDKITLKEEAKQQVQPYHDWEAHVKLCEELGIDPHKYTEAQAQSLADLKREYDNIDKGEDYE